MPAPKAPFLFRRHTRDCHVHKTKLNIRKKRAFVDCDCPIWVAGRTATTEIPRQSTGTRDWRTAEGILRALIEESEPKAPTGPTIAECIQKYLASHRHELSDKTYGQYRLQLNRLERYCAQNGVAQMADLTVDLLETFKVHGLEGLAETSKSTAVAKLRCFLREAFRRGWITTALLDRLRPHRAVYEQKEPYSDEEVAAILTESLRLTGGSHGYAKHPRTFRLLLELMLETGMRVGDAIRYDPARITKGERLWIYSFVAQKRRKGEKARVIEAYLPERLKKAIDECEWLSPSLPFAYGTSRNSAYLANEVYARMQTIGTRCGVADCRPHRLRDTFAVRKLLAGLQLDDVARLLGHSSVRVTETYYAKWVASRKIRLERLLAETMEDV